MKSYVESFVDYLNEVNPMLNLKYSIPRNAGLGADIILPVENNARLFKVFDDISDDEAYSFDQTSKGEDRYGIPYNKALYVILISNTPGNCSPNSGADSLVDQIISNTSITSNEITANDFDVADIIVKKSAFKDFIDTLDAAYGEYQVYDDPSGKGKLAVVNYAPDNYNSSFIIVKFA